MHAPSVCTSLTPFAGRHTCLDGGPLHAGYWADYCKVQHTSSGLCVAMSGWPGQLQLQDCGQAWNQGNMWRFCDATVTSTGDGY